MADTEDGAGQDPAGPASGGEQDTGDTPSSGDSFQAVQSQEELDRIVAKRVERERSKFSDYEDLKQKASKLDEMEEAQKSELQRITDRAEYAEEDAEKARQELLRYRIAHDAGLPSDNVDLILTASDEETMRKQAELWANHQVDTAGPSKPRPTEVQGTYSERKPTNADMFADMFK